MRDVLGFEEIDQTMVAVVGGKGANLGELSRLGGVRVPPGFCVTAGAFRRITAEVPAFDAGLARLSGLKLDDRVAMAAVSAELRHVLEGLALPESLSAAIFEALAALAELGEQAAFAVRSSATAEDLATASFAGQQDTFLNVRGREAVLRHVTRCWASLFTDRAVIYRVRNGIDHRKVHMAVVVQQMVFPQVAGILFTADPVTGHRKISSIEATYGLGEALVSGLVDPDRYRVRDRVIVARTIGKKQRALRARAAGGTEEQPIEQTQQAAPALTDPQIVRLCEIGRRIEAHFGRPQDIEWCWSEDDFFIVQSRPITTLFPVPVRSDQENHVYVSVGHQQMMTDAMKPLGLSVRQLTSPSPMYEAGGRLFVDVTRGLASPASRAGLLAMLGRSDPLIGDSLAAILERGDFIPVLPDEGPRPAPAGTAPTPLAADAKIVSELIARSEASLATLKHDIEGKEGPALFDFILTDLQELKRLLFEPRNMQAIMAGMEATWWLNEQLEAWLGEKSLADTLTQSVPHNVTSEMGLALLDVADAIRPHPEVVAFLEHAESESVLEELPKLSGGREARDAFCAWLARYGMRGVGRSILPGRAGANVRACSCEPSSTTSGTSSRAPASDASKKDGETPPRRSRRCSHACGPCRRARPRLPRPSA